MSDVGGRDFLDVFHEFVEQGWSTETELRLAMSYLAECENGDTPPALESFCSYLEGWCLLENGEDECE